MTLIIYPHFRSSATLNMVAFFDCFDTKKIKEKNLKEKKWIYPWISEKKEKELEWMIETGKSISR